MREGMQSVCLLHHLDWGKKKKQNQKNCMILIKLLELLVDLSHCLIGLLLCEGKQSTCLVYLCLPTYTKCLALNRHSLVIYWMDGWMDG